MILEKQTQSLIHEVGSTKATIGMSLDLDSAQILMQMLSKNLYSDAIGSTIRECASNALDSHRRADVDTPIVVSFKSNNNGYEFSVEDFGIGLDADDVENIISKYGKSTKRNSTTELGMMGLGFKAPLAYASSFYFITRKDGIERKYMMYEGEEVNSIDLLSQTSTTEGNGVKIIVPVKYSDYYDFKKKIKEQLAYFENVYFDVPDMNNTFKIYRSDHYQISEVCDDDHMHICLDDVYYSIDFDKLGIKTIYSKIALRFSLTDGLFPTPNREALRYTQEAKHLILNKIKTLANELMTTYNASIVDTDDIFAIINHFSNSNRFIIDYNNKQWEVSNILKYAEITAHSPVLIGYNYFTAHSLYKLKDYMLKEYECKYNLSKHSKKIQETSGKWNSQIEFRNINLNDEVIAVYTEMFTDRKRRYIKELWNKRYVKFVKKSHPFTLFSKNKDVSFQTQDISCYYDLLNLRTIPKVEWRNIITEFQKSIQKITENFINLDDIKIPEQWIINDKAKNYKPKPIVGNNNKVKEKGDVSGKKAVQPERETAFNAKFIPIVYDGKTLNQRKKLIVYAKEENRLSLDHLFGMFKNLQNTIEFIILSDREIKSLEMYNLHNFMSLDIFLKGNNKPFKRMMTAKLIFSFKKLYSKVFDARNTLEDVSLILKQNLRDMYNYQKDMICVNAKETNTTLKLEEYACKHNLYDLKMFAKLNLTDKLLSKHPFIKKLCNKMFSSYGLFEASGLIDVMKDMCRYKKMRMNLDNYNLVKKEDVDVLEKAA